ncbi:MAG TPA: hypothetical protein VEC16_03955 [Alphaproteobacteria bacterium]|nr:hypothetical protein [Alphaproteobacteria bacterium]
MSDVDVKHDKEFQILLGRLADIKYELKAEHPDIVLKHFENIQWSMRLLPTSTLKKEIAAVYGKWTVKLKEAKNSELKKEIDEACRELIKLLN